MPIQCTCAQCGAVFSVGPASLRRGHGIYCSKPCYFTARRRGETRTCPTCKHAFFAPQHVINKGHGTYCSDACMRSRRTGEHRSCAICETPFYAPPKTVRAGYGFFCSMRCKAISQRTDRRDRSSWRYREWRAAVFARDNYICQRCGNRGGDLHAHHIKRWNLYPALRFEISNGLTLHEQCHMALHSEQRAIFGWAEPT